MPKLKLAEPAYPTKRSFRVSDRSTPKPKRRKRKKGARVAGCPCRSGKIGA